MSDIDTQVKAFATQALGCFALDAPLYGRLNEHCAADVRAGGPVGTLVSGWPGDPRSGFLPLRVLGAVHALVLAGEAPGLGHFYPSVGGSPQWPDVWEAFRSVVATRVDDLRPMLDVVPQTNEVQRSAALLAGFLSIAQRAQLPLRLRELGSSAGLNLLWDRYRYELGPHGWGDPAAKVVIRLEWDGSPPPLEATPVVESRATGRSTGDRDLSLFRVGVFAAGRARAHRRSHADGGARPNTARAPRMVATGRRSDLSGAAAATVAFG